MLAFMSPDGFVYDPETHAKDCTFWSIFAAAFLFSGVFQSCNAVPVVSFFDSSITFCRFYGPETDSATPLSDLVLFLFGFSPCSLSPAFPYVLSILIR